MKRLPECQAPQDTDAWEEEIKGITPLPQPEEKPEAPLILKDVSPSPKMENVYNRQSFSFLQVGDTSNLDKNTAAKFRNGLFKIEARLDLHGQTEKQAYLAVLNFIRDSFALKRRCVLIITGKGLKKDDDYWYEPKGIIKEALPAWLNHDEIRPFILSICHAQVKDGGDGAMYILLKRQRTLQQTEEF